MANECFLTADSNCGCDNTLDIKKICVRCADICWQKSKQIWVEDLNTNNLCSQNLKSTSQQTESLTTNNLCAVSANINDLCVTNLRASNLMMCNTSRGYVSFSGNFSYTLGDPINFNFVNDDPSSMVSMVPNTHFVANKTGYWVASVFINASSLAGSMILTGSPVAKLSISVNGVSRKAIFVPFLTFSSNVFGLCTSHLLLSSGDLVSAILEVLVLDPSSGIINYAGTMMIAGGPLATTQDASAMDLIFLSDLCGGGTQPSTCIPCVPFENQCQVVDGPPCNPCPTK